MRRLVVLSILGCLVLLLSACGGDSLDADEGGSQLHVYVFHFPKDVDAWVLPEGEVFLYALWLYNGGSGRIVIRPNDVWGRRIPFPGYYNNERFAVNTGESWAKRYSTVGRGEQGYTFTSLTVYTIRP